MNTQSQSYLRLICDGAHAGDWNMVVDEFLLRNQIKTEDQNPILRFYRFSEPTTTVGYGVWRSIAETKPFDHSAIRRITGGGIVLHRPEDLTYSLVISLEHYPVLRKVKESYFLIHDALKESLSYFGIDAELFDQGCKEPLSVIARQRSKQGRSNPRFEIASSACQPPRNDVRSRTNYFCFESPVVNDVIYRGRKIAGAGQKRTLGYLLHQGSMDWKALSQASVQISERDFCHEFSERLGSLIGIRAEEISLDAEELKELATVA